MSSEGGLVFSVGRVKEKRSEKKKRSKKLLPFVQIVYLHSILHACFFSLSERRYVFLRSVFNSSCGFFFSGKKKDRCVLRIKGNRQYKEPNRKIQIRTTAKKQELGIK